MKKCVIQDTSLFASRLSERIAQTQVCISPEREDSAEVTVPSFLCRSLASARS
ncbi:hypothetical protein Lalb_Chr25g0278641 [Lupinus albus]|uniref:Uncharacterized protein n=1 Tax=Lupinus albus TaxID=3870 RepID=A0A6A4NCX8_LUPAL|nr:hypothetical protein Lalb_Chr25g0278641 [Lupinus albus]